jgi:hypothetical protein
VTSTISILDKCRINEARNGRGFLVESRGEAFCSQFSTTKNMDFEGEDLGEI